MHDHPFAPFVRTLGRGKRSQKELSREEAADAMGMILRGEASPAQIGAFLMLLRVKEASVDEMAGFRDACLPLCADNLAVLPTVDVDWPSYAGKHKHHPWYLAAARLLADNGVRILMHGGPVHADGRLYGDQALAELGLTVAGSVAEAADQLQQNGLIWLDLKHFCSPLAQLLLMRFELGLRSPVNTLVRCLNPAAATLSVQSVFHPTYLQLHLETARKYHGYDLLLFKGEGGEAEIRPDARGRLIRLLAGELQEETLDADLPRQAPPASVSAQQVRAVWRDEVSDAYGLATIHKTTAAILWGLGRAASFDEGEQLARTLWSARNRDVL